MARYKPLIFTVESDQSTNLAKTTAQFFATHINFTPFTSHSNTFCEEYYKLMTTLSSTF